MDEFLVVAHSSKVSDNSTCEKNFGKDVYNLSAMVFLR